MQTSQDHNVETLSTGVVVLNTKMCEKNKTHWHNVSSVNSVCNRKEN